MNHFDVVLRWGHTGSFKLRTCREQLLLRYIPGIPMGLGLMAAFKNDRGKGNKKKKNSSATSHSLHFCGLSQSRSKSLTRDKGLTLICDKSHVFSIKSI